MTRPLNHETARGLTVINQSNFETGIVHIGLGNFHRAHFAIYTAKAMDNSGGDWGICAFTFRNKELVTNLKAQDNLYSVLEIGPDTEAAYIPRAHSEFVAGYENANYVSKKIADPSVKIISLTITEAGYFLNNQTGELDWEHPDIKNDLAGESSRTIYGLITNGLIARGSHPITIISCDNITHNGDLTKKLLTQFIQKKQPELLEFLNEKISFPNSMVDRIVPGTETKHVELAQARLGITDLAPVPCEKFTMWALEDNFIAGRPDWQDVIFTDEVEAFEQMKLMLLNGSHSLLAYLGGLLNCATIPDCRFNTKIESALHRAINDEFLPATRLPKGIDSAQYISQLFMRWSNTVLGDKTYRVGSDGSTKLPQRITKPALLALQNGKSPSFMALIVAAWLACIAPLTGEMRNEICEQMKDANRELLQSLDKSSVTAFVKEFFDRTNIFPESLSRNAEFTALVLKFRQLICDQGIEAAIDLALLAT